MSNRQKYGNIYFLTHPGYTSFFSYFDINERPLVVTQQGKLNSGKLSRGIPGTISFLWVYIGPNILLYTWLCSLLILRFTYFLTVNYYMVHISEFFIIPPLS